MLEQNHAHTPRDIWGQALPLSDDEVQWQLQQSHFFNDQWKAEKATRGALEHDYSADDAMDNAPEFELQPMHAYEELMRQSKLRCQLILLDLSHKSFFGQLHVINCRN